MSGSQTIYKREIMENSLNLCSCITCHKEFSSFGIGKHYLNKHLSKSSRDTGKHTQKFQLRISCIICKKETSVQNLQRHFNKCSRPIELHECVECMNKIDMHRKFCDKSCAAKFNSRLRPAGHESRLSGNLNRSNKLKLFHQHRDRAPKFTKISLCVICKKWFEGYRKCCSKECRSERYSIIGRENAVNKPKRSKDEIILYELCHKHFQFVEHNKPMFNGWDADVLIHDHKIAIMWNGPWHYKEMGHSNHSLKQVQTRDKIKKIEIEKAGWKCIIYEDIYFTPEGAFTHIMELIGRSDSPIPHLIGSVIRN